MVSAKQILFSIIVPSYNRADELEELLYSICLLNYPRENFEIIISDDGSTDNTATLVKFFQDKNILNLVSLTQENRGPGAARNHGLKHVRGNFIIFVDSDVTMPKNWLMNIASKIDSEKADAFGGPDTFRDDFPPLLKAINYSMTSFITTGGLRGKKGKKLAKFYPRSFNMGLSKKMYQKIGGFSSIRHGQDIEYSQRIIESGAKVVFVENAPVYHKRRTNLTRFYKQVFNWGVARINLYKVNPKMLEPLHTIPAVATLISAILIILAGFSTLFFIIFQYSLLLALLFLIFSIIDSIFMYKSIRPAIWLPIVMPAQVFGYGCGFIFNFVRRVILKKGESTGFKKNYYK